mmetsp:Transcript_29904/g.87338  ORF Transcript_29904/g.87338 Transcript_29904/m.87338 type:complete len:399 (+) Transcript_29904:778-1974(+)
MDGAVDAPTPIHAGAEAAGLAAGGNCRAGLVAGLAAVAETLFGNVVGLPLSSAATVEGRGVGIHTGRIAAITDVVGGIAAAASGGSAAIGGTSDDPALLVTVEPNIVAVQVAEGGMRSGRIAAGLATGGRCLARSLPRQALETLVLGNGAALEARGKAVGIVRRISHLALLPGVLVGAAGRAGGGNGGSRQRCSGSQPTASGARGGFDRCNARGGVGHVGRNGRRLRGGRGRGHETGGRDGPLLRPFLRRQAVGIVVVRCHPIEGRPLLGSEFLLFFNSIDIGVVGLLLLFHFVDSLTLLVLPLSFVWCHRSLVCFLRRDLSSTSSGINGLWWHLGGSCGNRTSSSSDITIDRSCNSRRTSSRRGIVLLLTLAQNRLGSCRWRSFGSCRRRIGHLHAV